MYTFQVGKEQVQLTKDDLALVIGAMTLIYPQKVSAIKYIRNNAHLGLKEAKDLVEFIVRTAIPQANGSFTFTDLRPAVCFMGHSNPWDTSYNDQWPDPTDIAEMKVDKVRLE